MENKPAEALEYLEAAAEDSAGKTTAEGDATRVRAFLYLGIAYLQLDRVNDAIAAYQKILPRAGAETARVAFNLGNAYFFKGDFAAAARSYTEALAADPSYASAYLNRANALVKVGDLKNALSDYETYISMEGGSVDGMPEGPAAGSSKKEQVERLAAVIWEELTQAERFRVQAEERAASAVGAAIAGTVKDAEAAASGKPSRAEEPAPAKEPPVAERPAVPATAETDRRKKLIMEVSGSLKSAAGDSKGVSTGFDG